VEHLSAEPPLQVKEASIERAFALLLITATPTQNNELVNFTKKVMLP
jgi:hypothetical protein